MDRKPSMNLNEPPAGELKLVLNDSPQFDKKAAEVKLVQQQPPQKRILIQKKESQ
jgi:hypothetical protein